jgi:hypothetical protein|tara:strand:+ start:10486 stop:10713 length:228 start_codon:yes stop_codon:yes gene_type:complete
MSVVSVAEVSSSWSVDGSCSLADGMDVWDEKTVLLAGIRCSGGRDALVGEVVEEAVSAKSLEEVDEGLGVWVISA